MSKLDWKDKRVLYELEANCRAPYHEIAKKAGISKQVLAYRINRLVREGVVSRFITAVNLSKLGYVNYEAWVQTSSLPMKEKKDFLEFLIEHPETRTIASCGGKFDLLIGCIAKNSVEFKEILRDIQNSFPGYMKRYSVSISSELYHYPRTYLPGGRDPRAGMLYGGRPQELKLDKMDRGILGRMSQNARIPITRLASEVGITPKTVRERIKKLESRGIILGYSTLTQPTKMGYQNYELLVSLRNITEKVEAELRTYCERNPHVTFLLFVMGTWDVNIAFDARDFNHFQEILIEFRTMFDDIIVDYEYAPVLYHHKLDYLPMFG